MTLRDTFRVTATSNPAVRDIAPAINGNQEALAELQAYVTRLEDRVTMLEGRAPGHVPESAPGQVALAGSSYPPAADPCLVVVRGFMGGSASESAWHKARQCPYGCGRECQRYPERI